MHKTILAALALPGLALASMGLAQQVQQPWQPPANDAAFCEELVANAWQRDLTDAERQAFLSCIAGDRTNVRAQTNVPSDLLTQDGLIGDLPWAIEALPAN
jgi:hypothetical protein